MFDYIGVMPINNWILLSPLLLGTVLLSYSIWQVVKEMKRDLRQFKSFQKEMDRTMQIVSASIPEMQSFAANAKEGAESGKALVQEAKDAYKNVTKIVAAIQALNMAPVHLALAYMQRERNTPQSRFQRIIGRVKDKAVEIGRDWLD